MSGIKLNRPTDIIKRRVRLCGTKDVMFDRYAGDNSTKLEVWQKLYLSPDRVIGMPGLNIMSLLSAHNTNSAPKRLRDKRKFKDIANACLSFVTINPTFLEFTRDGKPIKFGKFVDDKDAESGCYVHYSVARLDKGIPNPKVRPVLPLPWALEFDFELFPNREIKEQEILNLFEEAGIAIGIGTYRGVFGKYFVDKWERNNDHPQSAGKLAAQKSTLAFAAKGKLCAGTATKCAKKYSNPVGKRQFRLC